MFKTLFEMNRNLKERKMLKKKADERLMFAKLCNESYDGKRLHLDLALTYQLAEIEKGFEFEELKQELPTWLRKIAA